MEHFDLAAFYGGSATELYRTLGAHRTPDGWVFRVWAPHAGSVSVVGDFCAWDPTAPSDAPSRWRHLGDGGRGPFAV